MAAPPSRHAPLIRFALVAVIVTTPAVIVCADEPAADAAGAPGGGSQPIVQSPDKAPPRAVTLTVPGSHYGIDERGRPTPGGALQLTLPIGYTLSGGQDTAALDWYEFDGDVRGLGSITQGLSRSGRGISLTLAGTDSAYTDSLAGHVQAQLWPETGSWPAISAGILDLTGNYQRSYYVAATKRLADPHPGRMVVEASELAWPPGEAAPSTNNPETWGRMTIAGDTPQDTPQAPTSARSIVVPHSPFPPRLDGVLGDEWSDATQVKLQLPNGEMLLLGAKHDGNLLYVTLGVPSDRYLTGNARAELCFASPHAAANQLTHLHRRYTVLWLASRGKPHTIVDAGAAGAWQRLRSIPRADEHRTSYMGAADNAGDGAWRYPVFEFAIPLWQLATQPGGPAIRFCAMVLLPAGQPRARLKRAEEHKLRWPWGRASYSIDAGSDVFSKRPDLWGDASLDAAVKGDGRISAPVTAVPPTIDGRVEAAEWQHADAVTHEFPSGIHQTLRAVRSDHKLYVASSWRMTAAQWHGHTIDLFLDPRGDEGIYPRADDRRLRIDCDGADVKLSAYSWHDVSGRWRPDKGTTFDAAASRYLSDTGVMYAVEFAIPLGDTQQLGSHDRHGAMGLAMEAAATIAPARMAKAGVAAETDMGKSTYVTAAWGTGVWEDDVMCGISAPIGDMRGIAEYDGSAFNLGVSSNIGDNDDLHLNLGWIHDEKEGGGTLGAGISTNF